MLAGVRMHMLRSVAGVRMHMLRNVGRLLRQ
jgi:hypothetical protein